MQNASEIKEKIMSIIEQSGPSLPVNLANKLNLSILFASAFLSELLSQNRLKISFLRVGNSPVYFIAGQEPKLENFSEHLKSKEKEAFLLLKEKKFLIDEVQQPAIRVALRVIKDFAISFEKNGKFIWRYFIVPESEFDEEPIEIKKIEEVENNKINETEVEQKREIEENIIEEKKEEVLEKNLESNIPQAYTNEGRESLRGPEKSSTKMFTDDKKKIVKKKVVKKKNDKFFNQVKEFLSNKSIEIVGIEGVSQNDLVLRVNEEGEEKLIIAYNKKRITELEIIKAYKKADELGLKYTILSLGEPLRKLSNLIDAINELVSIEKLE